jgi:hypothetical protein
MSLRISVENVTKIDEGIWLAQLNPSEVRILGECSANYGDPSVLLLLEPAEYNESSQKVIFNPKAVQLLNIGNSNKAIILDGLPDQIGKAAENGLVGPSREETRPEPVNEGDSKFITELPPDLKDLGEMLLAEVRKHFRGELKYHARSRKYVETPDNFWTVIIQPRDKSLRITVRGIPQSFAGYPDVSLKDDMSGYSAFKVTRKDQINSAVSIIKKASQR